MSYGIYVSALEFSYRLDSLFGYEDSVKCRRAHYSSMNFQYYESGHGYFGHCIGSRCDGCNFIDSDIDVMFVHDKCVVDESYEERGTSSSLLAVSSPRSSYVQIHLGKLFASADLPLNRTLIYYNNRMLFSSSLFTLANYHANKGNFSFTGITGPSITVDLGGKSNDAVEAFRCAYWPNIAKEWIYRRRKYSWPKPKLVTFIKSKGCYYVPVGEYNSPYYHLEWRVSFVLSECALVRSFNHVQFKVYCLLKLLNMDLQSAYKHSITQESLITSYHMKTIIFFAIENSPISFWSNSNIFVCFRMCLVYLRNAVISNYLPHYFLPQCNLFKKLSENYPEATHINWELKRYISNPLILIKFLLKKYGHEWFEFSLPGRLDMISYSLLEPLNKKNSHIFINSVLDNINFLSDFEFILVTKMTLDNIYFNNHYNEREKHRNKTSWVTNRRAQYISLRKTHCDLAAGWLQLSNFYYVTKQYYKAEHICRKVITSISPDVWHVGHCGDIISRILSNHQMDIQIKRFTANYISLHANGLYPNEIDLEVVNYPLSVMSILPLPYAYFLLFLCAYHRRCDVATQCKILCSLESLIYNNIYGLNIENKKNTLIILNMVGICYELLRDKHRAAFYYWKSTKTRDAYNSSNKFAGAAFKRLQLLMIKRE